MQLLNLINEQILEWESRAVSFNTSHPGRIASCHHTGVVAAAILLAVVWSAPVYAEAVLDSGQSYIVTPPQTECLEIEQISPDNAILPVARAECDTATGEADVTARDNRSRRTINAVASSVFQYNFRVEDTGAGPRPSLIPIHVRVPTEFAARLVNGHLVELAGLASMDIFLQLRQDPDPATGSRGTVIERATILGMTHGGTAGCLSLPLDPSGMEELVIGCVIAAFQRARGSSNTTLNAIVEVGRSYNLELQIVARAYSVGGTTAIASATTDVVLPTAPGLKWSRMFITLGTDPAMIVADLQAQIDQLREDLENHTHNYLTGKGAGHNNTLAVSSAAIIPGDSAGGLTEDQLKSGPGKGPAAGPGMGGIFRRNGF